MEVLAAKLERMQTSLPIALDSVDVTFANPQLVSERLGGVFRYFGRVENEVDGYVEQIHTMLPHTDAGDIGEFLPVWRAHEVPHGQIFDQAQTVLGLEPFMDFPTEMPAIARLIGRVAAVSPAIERVVQAIYFSHAAKHEKLTDTGYRRMANLLENLGEHAFVATAIKRILPQEAMHLGWYRVALQQFLPHLSHPERRLANLMDRVLYQPVGAKKKEHRAGFGHVAQTLVGEGVQEFTDNIQAVSDQAFGEAIPRRHRVEYVATKVLECIARAEQKTTAN